MDEATSLSKGTTLLFGLAGMRVDRVELRPGGIREVHVQTADEGASGCRCVVCCRRREGQRGHRAARHPLRDKAYRGGVAPSAGGCCASGETSPRRSRAAGRCPHHPALREAIAVAIGDANRAVNEVADAFGVSWPTAHTAFVDVADRVLATPAPTRVLGIDETRRRKPRWEQHPTTGRRMLVGRWTPASATSKAPRGC